jgi:Ca2+-binding RTX toxin-like protein
MAMNVTLGSGDQAFALLRSGGPDDTILDFKSIYFDAALTGAQEVPPRVSAASGAGAGSLNFDQTRFAFSVALVGIDIDGAQTPGSTLDNKTDFHIHRAAAGVGGGIVYNPAADAEFVQNAPAGTLASGWDAAEGLSGANLAALLADGTYFNVHTVRFTGGEIRGQILKADNGLDQIDLTALNIGNFATAQRLMSEAAGTATISALFNGLASKVSLKDIGIAQLAAADFVFAGIADDTLNGTANADDLFGAGGTDTLNGLAGADRIFGEDGNDTLDGGADADTMDGGLGNDIFKVDAAGDIVAEALSQGVDQVQTALASYTLGANVEKLQFTDAGAHTGKGNALNNTLNGNAGDDKFLVDAGGNDVFSGGNGSDSLDFRASATGAIINLATGVHGGAALGDIFASIEKFFGSNTATDTMTAGAGRANFSGFGGNDTLTGGATIDVLAGGDGTDTLSGGGGIDTLQGGKGDDTMAGGAGADLFLYIETAASGGWGADTVTDFQDGQDRIKIDSPGVAASIADFTIAGNGTASVLLTLAAAPANTIALNGAAAITITAADFLFF